MIEKHLIVQPEEPTERQFFVHLKEHRLTTTRCPACGTLAFPPRPWCHVCLSPDLEWIDLSGRGKLTAFSTKERGTRFNAPDVIGLVDLDEGVRLLSRIVAPLDDLRLGQLVTVEFIDVGDGVVLHQFLPVGD